MGRTMIAMRVPSPLNPSPADTDLMRRHASARGLRLALRDLVTPYLAMALGSASHPHIACQAVLELASVLVPVVIVALRLCGLVCLGHGLAPVHLRDLLCPRRHLGRLVLTHTQQSREPAAAGAGGGLTSAGVAAEAGPVIPPRRCGTGVSGAESKRPETHHLTRPFRVRAQSSPASTSSCCCLDLHLLLLLA